MEQLSVVTVSNLSALQGGAASPRGRPLLRLRDQQPPRSRYLTPDPPSESAGDALLFLGKVRLACIQGEIALADGWLTTLRRQGRT